jgi:hypothetical protein
MYRKNFLQTTTLLRPPRQRLSSYALAGTVANGKDFIGLETRHLPVLYLDGENPLAIAKRNLEELGLTRNPDLRIWGGWNDSPPPGPDSPIVKSFALQHHGLLIWDSLVEFHPGDEQSSTETREFMKHFRRLAHLGATVLILHHTGKSGTSKRIAVPPTSKPLSIRRISWKVTRPKTDSIDWNYKTSNPGLRRGSTLVWSLSRSRGSYSPLCPNANPMESRSSPRF